MRWKFTPALAASLFAASVFAHGDKHRDESAHKPDRSEGLLVDHETAVEKCGVGNYLFRYLKDGCNPRTASSSWMDDDRMAREWEARDYEVAETEVTETEATDFDDTIDTSASVAESTTSDTLVYYPLGVSELSDERKDELDETASFLKDNPNASVEIMGYADATGGREVSEQVARERAQKAREYLISSGVAANQVQVITPDQPVSENMDNALDRRTELRIQTYAE